MNIRTTIKKILFGLYNSHRVVLLDYPIKPERLYREELQNPHEGLYKQISANNDAYRDLLHSALRYSAAFSSIRRASETGEGIEPGWNNGHFPGLDIIMLYTMMARYRPHTYLEIGSGNSTRVAFKAKRDEALSTQMISIDPNPRKDINAVTDQVYRDYIQNINLEVFEALGENDIIFFDGTHTLYPNSDVTWFFLEVLPRLKKGVIVQIHDIYLPYDYPPFMCERYYNEQYILAAVLQAAPQRYEVLSPNYFLYTEKDLHAILAPIWQLPALKAVEPHGGSFWFRVR